MAQLQKRLEGIFSLEQPLHEFNGEKLELFGRGMDDPLQGLEISLQQLDSLKETGNVDEEVLEKLLVLGSLVLEELNAHDELILDFGYKIAVSVRLTLTVFSDLSQEI